MKMQKNNIACNLTALRQLNKFSQEEVAERIGVSRQAVAKWEAGRSGTSWNRANERRFFSGDCPAVQNCFKYDRCP